MSSRYVPGIIVVVALALVPTIIHSYSGPPVPEAWQTGSLSIALAGLQGQQSDRNASWGERRFDSFDWTERRYTGEGENLVLTVLRSYDAKALYHHPELAVAYGNDFAPVTMTTLPKRPDLPVYLLEPDPGGSARALYALHYDQAFVADPIRFQLASAMQLLFTRRKPMTLFFVLDRSGPDRASLDSLRAGDLLLAAIDDFLSAK